MMSSSAVSALGVVLDVQLQGSVELLRRAEQLHADAVNLNASELRLLASCMWRVHVMRELGVGGVDLCLDTLVYFGLHHFSFNGVNLLKVARLIAARGYEVLVWDESDDCVFSVSWMPSPPATVTGFLLVAATGPLEEMTKMCDPQNDSDSDSDSH